MVASIRSAGEFARLPKTRFVLQKAGKVGIYRGEAFEGCEIGGRFEPGK